MTDHELLEDPSGTPYPESTQRLARSIDRFERGVYTLDISREDLVDAIEAAIAADREHRPPAPPLDQEQTRRLMRIWLSGFYSGAKSALANLGTDPHTAEHYAGHLVHHLEQDPIAYAIVEGDNLQLFVDGTSPDNRRIIAHGLHPDQPRDQKDD